MGMSLGMTFAGKRVISVFPRWNFLLCATNQLVNHVDKYKLMSEEVLELDNQNIRSSERPLFPGHQHTTIRKHFERCLKMSMYGTQRTEQIFDGYKNAYERKGDRSTLVEFGDYYNEK